MPMMPFIGVRISWLMFARNSLLARLAASAVSLAARSSAAARAFSSARAAWSANACARRISSAWKLWPAGRPTESAPIAWSRNMIGTASTARNGSGAMRARTSAVRGVRGSARTSSAVTGRRSRTATPDAPVPAGTRTPSCQSGPASPDTARATRSPVASTR